MGFPICTSYEMHYEIYVPNNPNKRRTEKLYKKFALLQTRK